MQQSRFPPISLRAVLRDLAQNDFQIVVRPHTQLDLNRPRFRLALHCIPQLEMSPLDNCRMSLWQARGAPLMMRASSRNSTKELDNMRYISALSPDPARLKAHRRVTEN